MVALKLFKIIFSLILLLQSLMGKSEDYITIENSSCLYDFENEDPTKSLFSESVLNALKTLQDSGKDCGYEEAFALQNLFAQDHLQNSWFIYAMPFAKRNSAGSHKSSEEEDPRKVQVPITCNNFVDLYNWEFKRALEEYRLGLPISEHNYFSGHCQELLDKEKKPIKAKGAFSQCLTDQLAKRLHDFQNQCEEKLKRPLSALFKTTPLKDHLLLKEKDAFAKEFKSKMKTLAQKWERRECVEQSDLDERKKFFRSFSGIAGALDQAGAINDGLSVYEFFFKKVDSIYSRYNTLGRYMFDREMDQKLCNFMVEQKKGCFRYHVNPWEPVQKCEGVQNYESVLGPINILLTQKFPSLKEGPKEITYVIGEENNKAPSLVQTIEPSYRKFLNYFEEKYFPNFEGGHKSLLDLLLEMKVYYLKKNDQSAIENLKNIHFEFTVLKRSFQDFVGLKDIVYSKTNRLGWEEFEEKEKKLKEMAGRMKEKLMAFDQDSLKKMNRLIINYLNEQQQKNEFSGLYNIFAQELSSEIYAHLLKEDELQRPEVSKITDNTNDLVEDLRGDFKKRIKYHFKNGFYSAWKDHNNGRLGTVEERKSTFAQIHYLVKDCLVGNGLLFMKRKKLNFFQKIIKRPMKYNKLDAEENIDTAPDEFMHYCAPFLCGEAEGMPLPDFDTTQTSHSKEYGLYQCQILDRAPALYQQIKKNFIEKGELCGKSIDQIFEASFKGKKLKKWKNPSSGNSAKKKRS